MTAPTVDAATCDARDCSQVAAWTVATCCEEGLRCQKHLDELFKGLLRHDEIQCRHCGVTYAPATRILRRVEAR